MSNPLEPVPDAAIVVLAVAGGVALVIRLLRSLARWALRSAEVVAASSSVETSARRGDLTGLADARKAERLARSAQRREGLMVGILFLSISIPFAVNAFGFYALAAPLWFFPRRR